VTELVRDNRLELLERKRLKERESDAHHSSTAHPKHAATFSHPGVHGVDQVHVVRLTLARCGGNLAH